MGWRIIDAEATKQPFLSFHHQVGGGKFVTDLYDAILYQKTLRIWNGSESRRWHPLKSWDDAMMVRGAMMEKPFHIRLAFILATQKIGVKKSEQSDGYHHEDFFVEMTQRDILLAALEAVGASTCEF